MIELCSRRVEDRLPGRQGRLLFAYLAVNRRRPVPRAELVDALWPRQPPSAPDLVLSPLISKLRRAVGDEVVQGRFQLRLALPAVDRPRGGDRIRPSRRGGDRRR